MTLPESNTCDPTMPSIQNHTLLKIYLLHRLELQREIKESLHRKPSTDSSIEDITKLSKFSSINSNHRLTSATYVATMFTF